MGRKGLGGRTAWAELLTAWTAMGWGRSVYLELIFSQFIFLSALDKTCPGVCVVYLRFKVTLYSAQHNKTLKEWGITKETGGFEHLKECWVLK